MHPETLTHIHSIVGRNKDKSGTKEQWGVQLPPLTGPGSGKGVKEGSFMNDFSDHPRRPLASFDVINFSH